MDDVFHQICARGACFLPLEIVGELYELGAHPTNAEISPQFFARVLALSMHSHVYANVLNWVQDTFTKVSWKNHPTLSYLKGPIQTSRSWVASDFEVNSLDSPQVS